MTFKVDDIVEMGQYNNFHDTVQWIQMCDDPGPVVIGDCNTIHENVKIVVGKAGFRMGDWNTIHNGVFIMDDVQMGHNCWIGQGSHLDGRGKLRLGNGVSVAFHSHIWSHVARGPLLDGCTLFNLDKTTTLEDDVWLVGDNIHIAPGVTIGEKAIIFAHSVVTKDVRAGAVCAGNPALERHDLYYHYWKPLSSLEKIFMMRGWVGEFMRKAPGFGKKEPILSWHYDELHIVLEDVVEGSKLVFDVNYAPLEFDPLVTHLDLHDMTYTKRLTQLERDFYAFIKDYKARFLPV